MKHYQELFHFLEINMIENEYIIINIIVVYNPRNLIPMET